MGLVRRFEEKDERTGRRFLGAQKYAEKLGMKLELRYPAENEKIEGCKIGTWKKKALQNKHCEGVRDCRESPIQYAGTIKILMVRVSSGCKTRKQHRRRQ